jgi:hypothetical protein
VKTSLIGMIHWSDRLPTSNQPRLSPLSTILPIWLLNKNLQFFWASLAMWTSLIELLNRLPIWVELQSRTRVYVYIGFWALWFRHSPYVASILIVHHSYTQEIDKNLFLTLELEIFAFSDFFSIASWELATCISLEHIHLKLMNRLLWIG